MGGVFFRVLLTRALIRVALIASLKFLRRGHQRAKKPKKPRRHSIVLNHMYRVSTPIDHCPLEKRRKNNASHFEINAKY